MSPIVFISLFLVLEAERPTRNGAVFVAGLVFACGVVTIVTAFVVNGRVDLGSSTDSGIF